MINIQDSRSQIEQRYQQQKSNIDSDYNKQKQNLQSQSELIKTQSRQSLSDAEEAAQEKIGELQKAETQEQRKRDLPQYKLTDLGTSKKISDIEAQKTNISQQVDTLKSSTDLTLDQALKELDTSHENTINDLENWRQDLHNQLTNIEKQQNLELLSQINQVSDNLIILNNGDKISKEVFNKLGNSEQKYLIANGIDSFNNRTGLQVFQQLKDDGKIPQDAIMTSYDSETGSVKYSIQTITSVKLSADEALKNAISNKLIPDNSILDNYDPETGELKYHVPISGQEALNKLIESGIAPNGSVLTSYDDNTGVVTFDPPKLSPSQQFFEDVKSGKIPSNSIYDGETELKDGYNYHTPPEQLTDNEVFIKAMIDGKIPVTAKLESYDANTGTITYSDPAAQTQEDQQSKTLELPSDFIGPPAPGESVTRITESRPSPQDVWKDYGIVDFLTSDNFNPTKWPGMFVSGIKSIASDFTKSRIKSQDQLKYEYDVYNAAPEWLKLISAPPVVKTKDGYSEMRYGAADIKSAALEELPASVMPSKINTNWNSVLREIQTNKFVTEQQIGYEEGFRQSNIPTSVMPEGVLQEETLPIVKTEPIAVPKISQVSLFKTEPILNKVVQPSDVPVTQIELVPGRFTQYPEQFPSPQPERPRITSNDIIVPSDIRVNTVTNKIEFISNNEVVATIPRINELTVNEQVNLIKNPQLVTASQIAAVEYAKAIGVGLPKEVAATHAETIVLNSLSQQTYPINSIVPANKLELAPEDFELAKEATQIASKVNTHIENKIKLNEEQQLKQKAQEEIKSQEKAESREQEEVYTKLQTKTKIKESSESTQSIKDIDEPKIDLQSNNTTGTQEYPIGTYVWQQGKLHGRVVYRILPPPWKQEDLTWSYVKPAGTIPVQVGKGASYRSVSVIGGVVPGEVDVDLGIEKIKIATDQYTKKPIIIFEKKNNSSQHNFGLFGNLDDNLIPIERTLPPRKTKSSLKPLKITSRGKWNENYQGYLNKQRELRNIYYPDHSLNFARDFTQEA